MDLGAAERNLTAVWGYESLFGGRVRLFTLDSLQAMANGALLAAAAERGLLAAAGLPPRGVRADFCIGA